MSKGELTPEEKKRRVVLKRVNIDKFGNPRADLLKRGTIARGASESGEIERYMNGKIWRNIFARSSAGYRGAFTCTESIGGFTKGTQWLAWDFESDCTLGDALEGGIGSFPEALEDVVMGKDLDNMNVDKRHATVIRRIFRKVRRCAEIQHDLCGSLLCRPCQLQSLSLGHAKCMLTMDCAIASVSHYWLLTM